MHCTCPLLGVKRTLRNYFPITPNRASAVAISPHGARTLDWLAGRAVDIEPVSVLISEIREYFNSRAEIFSLLLRGKFEFVTQRQLPNSKSAAVAASSRQQPKHMKRLDWLAGAPGFEPGNGGIKIRCLTTWLRPNRCRRAAPNSPRTRRPDHSGADRPNQRPLLIYIKCGLTGLWPRLD